MSVYQNIRSGIISGELRSGTTLVELSMAERYGVSRTPVREALLQLERDGLVERRPQGMVVRERSPEEILEIYEARIALEGAVAAAAAQRRTELDLAKVRHALGLTAEADPTDSAVAVRLNRAFHSAVWAAGHNTTLVDLLMRLESHLSRYSGTTLLYPGRWQVAIQEHVAIAAAIEAQDRVLAERLVREHFTRAQEIRMAMFAEAPES